MGVQEATAAAENSLNSRGVSLFCLFLFEKFLLFKPPVQTSTWPLTQPSLALSQESCSRPCTPAVGFSCPGPRTGPRDLIVLKHSFYRLIFQCPLSLVSDLHICWNTVGCSLCSSDQLAVSLVLRGSGLCSHLSWGHLPQFVLFNPFTFSLISPGTLPNWPASQCSPHLFLCLFRLFA